MLNRRSMLRLLGLGTAAAAVPATAEPIRRIWQVSAAAPVRSGTMVATLDAWMRERAENEAQAYARYMRHLEEHLRELSGLNSVARGSVAYDTVMQARGGKSGIARLHLAEEMIRAELLPSDQVMTLLTTGSVELSSPEAARVVIERMRVLNDRGDQIVQRGATRRA